MGGLWLALFGTVLADPVRIWADGSIPHGAPMAGARGWDAGWAGDAWVGGDYYGWGTPAIFSMSDANQGDDPDSLHNVLANTAVPVRQGVWTAAFYTEDDDSLGIVVARDATSYVLFTLCGASGSNRASCPFGRSGRAYLVRMNAGSAEILASARASYELNWSWDRYVADGTLALDYNDGTLVATWPEGGVTLTAAMGLDRLGSVGLWAYDAGYEGNNSNNSNTAFPSHALYAHDDDDDRVIDDDDNCEKAPNTDQSDRDSDGVGDVCDPTPDGTGTSTNTGTNTGTATNTGTDANTGTATNTGTDANTGSDANTGTDTNTGAPTGTDTNTDDATSTDTPTGTDTRTADGSGTDGGPTTETAAGDVARDTAAAGSLDGAFAYPGACGCDAPGGGPAPLGAAAGLLGVLLGRRRRAGTP